MQPSELLKRYRTRLETETYSNWDRFTALRKFIKSDHQIPRTQVSVLTLNSEGSQEPVVECNGYLELADFLNNSVLESGACRLFLVENLCPETISLLHERFGVEADVFAKHVNNEPWFRGHDIADLIPELPSVLDRRSFLQIRHIEALSVYGISNPDNPPPLDVLDILQDRSVGSWDDGIRNSNVKGYGNFAPAWRVPDKGTARIPRPAEKIKPNPRPNPAGSGMVLYPPLLCTRYHTIAWYKRNSSGGWIGIILLDPAFQATLNGRNGEQYLLRRSEILACDLPSLTNNATSPLKSSRKIIADSWKKMDQAHGKLAVSNCFITLHILYSLVAHSWVVFNEYMNQELSTIEYILENSEPAFTDLEAYLKAIYCYRRQCDKYNEIITHTKEQCSTSGQKSWHPHSGAPESEMTKALEQDFKYLQCAFQQTETRIDKNINLLTTLVAIGAAKQGLEESKGITRLTLFAAIFVPASTVATILGMEGLFGPTSGKFWIFWAAAVPLTLTAVGIVFVAALKKFVLKVMKMYSTLKKRERIGTLNA
ncbi:hypothetical protein B0O99DRAFT_319478 [Bisporella sp. PMI_857]|nr:hypothetical protein B0O99DRAFT_319478 [Bisporella sp. PMI_857]